MCLGHNLIMLASMISNSQWYLIFLLVTFSGTFFIAYLTAQHKNQAPETTGIHWSYLAYA